MSEKKKERKGKGSGREPNLDVVVVVVIINSLLFIIIRKEIHAHLKCKSSIKCRKIQTTKTKPHNNGHPVIIIKANCIWVYLLMIFSFYVNVQRFICVFVLYICMLIFLILLF